MLRNAGGKEHRLGKARKESDSPWERPEAEVKSLSQDHMTSVIVTWMTPKPVFCLFSMYYLPSTFQLLMENPE